MPNAEGPEGSQSPVVVALATALFVAFALGSVYLLLTGPSPDSVFRGFRSPTAFYPMAGLSVLVFSGFAWLGFKRLRYLLKQRKGE